MDTAAQSDVKQPGRRVRDHSGFQSLVLVAPEGQCKACGAPLEICQHRERPLQTLTGRFWVVSKDRRCSNHEACSSGAVLYRPLFEDSVDRFILKKREYGLDIICFIGEQYLRKSTSLPKLHKELRKRGVLISESHVGNLFRLFLALMKCRDGDDDGLRARLYEQGRVVVSIDAVKFDDITTRLYVIRDVLSGEVLFCERIEMADTAALTRLLKRAAGLGVPIQGIVSDKEQAIVLAAQAAFPGVPHQLCQYHYLKNLVRDMETDVTSLGARVKTIVEGVKVLEQTMPHTKMSAEERETAQALCHATKTIGKSRAGDSLLAPPALRRYERLTEAAEMTRKAVEKADQEWPFVARLLAVLAALKTWAELGERLQRQFAVIHSIARALQTETSSDKVKELLRQIFEELEVQPRSLTTTPFEHFVEHITGVTERFWSRLFHCYDHADIPPNNNDLERMFGMIKRQQRRVHGRRSTAGGPLDGCAEVLLEVWSHLDQYPDLMAAVMELPADKLQLVRKEMDRLAGPSQLRRGIARDPMGYLQRVLARTTAPKE